MYIYIYIYIYTHSCIYIERERGTEREREIERERYALSSGFDRHRKADASLRHDADLMREPSEPGACLLYWKICSQALNVELDCLS